jgi:hypothetical protein
MTDFGRLDDGAAATTAAISLAAALSAIAPTTKSRRAIPEFFAIEAFLTPV